MSTVDYILPGVLFVILLAIFFALNFFWKTIIEPQLRIPPYVRPQYYDWHEHNRRSQAPALYGYPIEVRR